MNVLRYFLVFREVTVCFHSSVSSIGKGDANTNTLGKCFSFFARHCDFQQTVRTNDRQLERGTNELSFGEKSAHVHVSISKKQSPIFFQRILHRLLEDPFLPSLHWSIRYRWKQLPDSDSHRKSPLVKLSTICTKSPLRSTPKRETLGEDAEILMGSSDFAI